MPNRAGLKLSALYDRGDSTVGALVRDYSLGRISATDFGKRLAESLVQLHARALAMGRRRAGGDGRLTRADSDIARTIVYGKEGQTVFIADFVGDLLSGRYTDAEGNALVRAILRRAKLYVRRLRGTANRSFVDNSAAGLYFLWLLGSSEHCPSCIALAAESPYAQDELPTEPGGGDTECFLNCNCYLLRSDGAYGFGRDD